MIGGAEELLMHPPAGMGSQSSGAATMLLVDGIVIAI